MTAEPKYQSNSPRYCLLAFGPKAEHRIWLVLDDKRLFVDRNGDGKLSEKGEVVLGKPRIGGREIAGKSTLFLIGELKTGKRTHRNVHLTTESLSTLPKAALKDPLLKKPYQQDPKALIYQLLADVEMPGFTGNQEGGRVLRMAYMDGSNLLQFAASPKNAPIVHMGGTSFEAVLWENKSFSAGKEADITVVVGTPGLGRGACALAAYETLIPIPARPVLEITWPKRSKTGAALVTKHILTQRC